MNRILFVVFVIVSLAACAAAPQSDSNWAIDQQVIYCANTRAGGFVLGDPRVAAGVPIVGPAVVAADEALKEEQACQVVRGLGAVQIASLKEAQLTAVRDGHAVVTGAFTITPHPIGADCVPLETIHTTSGIALREERLCKRRQGGYAPYGAR